MDMPKGEPMTNSEALKKMQSVKAYMTSGNPIWSVTEIGEAFDMAIEALEAEPKKGKWKRKIVDSGFNADWICSECGHRLKTEYATNYCPNCGAKMERDE